jgi:hypothetical protein
MADEENKRTAYIPIQYPFTLDVSRDPRDNINASGGIFTKLTNYITGRHNLETRCGITEFEHT